LLRRRSYVLAPARLKDAEASPSSPTSPSLRCRAAHHKRAQGESDGSQPQRRPDRGGAGRHIALPRRARSNPSTRNETVQRRWCEDNELDHNSPHSCGCDGGGNSSERSRLASTHASHARYSKTLSLLSTISFLLTGCNQEAGSVVAPERPEEHTNEAPPWLNKPLGRMPISGQKWRRLLAVPQVTSIQKNAFGPFRWS
jgi:hypothetical protein